MKTQRLSVDRISSIPPNIIETILCLVPIREATRTSTLSKEWKYNWTKIPKVVFDENTFEVSTDENNYPFNVIYQVLLLHQGPIVEFTLSVWEYDTCVEVDQMILHLSRMNTVKKLRLGYLCRIPLGLFSLHQLTDLYIHGCRIHQQQTFNAISSITTLSIEDVEITKKTLVNLLSNCPLLKTFSLLQGYDHIHSDDDSGLIELFECLPVIENLTLYGIRCFGEREHPRELPTSLYDLKYICLYDLCLSVDSHYGLPFLALLIRASPNVEKIKLRTFTITKMYLIQLETNSDSDEELDAGEDYSDIRLKV